MRGLEHHVLALPDAEVDEHTLARADASEAGEDLSLANST
jgi:hypothetical protein